MKTNANERFDINNVSAVAGIEDSNLGHIEFHTISECEITRENLERMLISHGFEKYLPKEISPSDAFRRATTDIQKSKVESATPDLYLNYLVREVYSDRFEIIRKIVVETVDKAGKTLSYKPEEATIRYDKKADTVEYKASSYITEELIDEAITLFEKHKVTYNSRHIREMCFNILSELSPISVKPSGGVYFVPASYTRELKEFISLVNELGESEAYKIPLMRNNENADMVRKKLQDHIKSAIWEAADYLKNPGFDKSNANQKLALVKKVVTDFSEYQRVLQDELADMDDSLSLLKMQAQKIVERLTDIEK